MVAVLHFVNSGSTGGAEKFVYELALAQAADGHRAAVVWFEGPEELEHGGAVAESRRLRMQEAGITVASVGRRARVNLAGGAIGFRRIVREFRPDVVHCHLLRACAVYGLSMVPAPSLYTHHNTPLKVSEPFFKLVTRRIDEFVAISNAGSAVLARVTPRRPVTIVNGIDLSGFDGPAAARRPGPFTLLSVGQMRPQKNYPYLLAIAEAVRRDHPDLDCRFRIVGDGEMRPTIERLIAEKGLGDQVELLGIRDDVSRLMRDADAYLLTSTFEGMPLALIEAMSSALPIVTTDVGACPDMVTDGENGFLVPVDDAGLVADRIHRLVDDPELRHRMAERSRTRSAGYSIEACHQGYLDVYRSLAGAG